MTVISGASSVSSKDERYYSPPESQWDLISDAAGSFRENVPATATTTTTTRTARAAPSQPVQHQRASAVQPGTYFIENEKGDEMVLDLAGYDFSTVLGYKKHGGENQKWEIEPLGLGYSIKSVFNSSYMTLQTGAIEGGSMIVSPFPVSWEIEAAEGDASGLWRIRWPRSDFMFDLPDVQKNAVILTSTKTSNATPRNHLWRLHQITASRQPLRSIVLSETTSSFSTEPMTSQSSGTVVVGVGFDPSELGASGEEEMEVTTTTTTVTTNVSRMRRLAVPKAARAESQSFEMDTDEGF